MEKEKIILSGGKILTTNEEQYYYHIISGKVIVYASYIEKDMTTGRKHFLVELCQEKDVDIPALTVNSQNSGKWVFVISALESAVLEKCNYANKEKEREVIVHFSTIVHLNFLDRDEFEEEIIEWVQRKLVTEELAIYRNQSENEKIMKESLKSIKEVFHQDKTISELSRTNNNLYNTVAFLCSKGGIKIAPYETLVASCGRRFTLQDIARVSHFMIREVHLEKDWYKQESGYLLIYKETKEEETDTLVACLSSGRSQYKEYNLEENSVRKVNESINDSYIKTAYMLYRPLPNKSLRFQDLVKFAIGEINSKDVAFIFILTFLSTLIGLLIPYLNQVIYDEYIPFGNTVSILQVGAIVMVFSISNLCFSMVKNILVYRVSAKIEYNLQSAVFDRLFNLPGTIYENNDSTVLAKSAFGITEICGFISEAIITTILSSIFSLAYLYCMYTYSSVLAMKGLIMVFLQLLILFLIGVLQLRLDKEITNINVKESSLIYQLIDGISKIRIAGAQNRALVKYINLYTKHKKILYKKDKLTNLSINVNAILNVVFIAVFYYILIKQSIHLSFGDFMAFMAAFAAFLVAALQMANTFLKANHLIPLYENFKRILKSGQEYQDNLQMPGIINGIIEANNVSFYYNEKEGNVLSEVSFKILEGEYIGIVGPSGSGKSTLLKLLLGFEKPLNGKIYYDEKDLDLLDKRELRKRFGVVLQEGKLISGSIYENIVLAGTNFDTAMKEKEADRVNAVVKEVGLDKDIKNMPMGLQTIIAEGAGTISGGQRQKILIARAIFNNPSVLFFDEATSALDNVNQDLVTKNLEKLKITRIVIAHRLSTVIGCDRILVMQNGRVVETGSYQELMDKKSFFYQLSHRQMA